MYPTVVDELVQAHIADMRRQAQRDALARAARCVDRRCRAGLRPGGPHQTHALPGTA
jgi:hypothetical protein